MRHLRPTINFSSRFEACEIGIELTIICKARGSTPSNIQPIVDCMWICLSERPIRIHTLPPHLKISCTSAFLIRLASSNGLPTARSNVIVYYSCMLQPPARCLLPLCDLAVGDASELQARCMCYLSHPDSCLSFSFCPHRFIVFTFAESR